MTQEDFNKLKNPDVFKYDYHWHDVGKNKKSELLLNKNILSKTGFEIAHLMDEIIDFLKPFNEQIEFLCFYESSGHSSNSQHYKGIACDFHFVNSKRSYYDQILLIDDYLTKVKYSGSSPLGESVGFGIYPGSNSQSLHLDTRGKKARWTGHFQYFTEKDNKGNIVTKYNVEYDMGIEGFKRGLESLKNNE